MKRFRYNYTVDHSLNNSKKVPHRILDILTVITNTLSLTLLSVTLYNTVEINCQLIEPVKSHCKNAETRLDQCSQKIITFYDAAQYPQSLAQLDRSYCPNFKQMASCIAKYEDCFKRFDRQIINWVLTATKRQNYKRCQNEEEKSNFVKLSSSCLTNMKSTMNDCMDRYIASLDIIADMKIAKGSPNDNQIQLSCCANRRFKECSLKQADRFCRLKTSFRAPRKILYTSARNGRLLNQRNQNADLLMIRMLEENLDAMHLTGPEFFCSSIDDQYCRSNYDKFYSNYSRPLHKSILPAMLKIYRN